MDFPAVANGAGQIHGRLTLRSHPQTPSVGTLRGQATLSLLII